MAFISRVAKFIHDGNFDLKSLTVILPSQRAIKYLSNALVKEFGGPIFAPKMLTIDQWVKTFYPNCIDRTRLLLNLYEVHKEIEANPESFEDFVQWATMLLSDFDDIDRYLLEPKEVFKNLLDIKELEAWNIEEREISETQKKFLAFWEKLPEYHEKLELRLKKRDKITTARAYRNLAEENLQLLSGNSLIFAGFNALSSAETIIIKKLIRSGQAHFLVDADAYFMEDTIHEAGLFIRRNIQHLELNDPNWIISNIGNKPLDVRIVECPQKTGQVKVAAAALAQLTEEELQSTAVILADETLISALVQNIPANVKQANITLGLPLTQTPVKSWVEAIFRIQENKKRFKTAAIYHADLMSFMHQIFVLMVASDFEKNKMADIELKTSTKNKVFQSPSKLDISAKINEILLAITEAWDDDWIKAISQIRELNRLLIQATPSSNQFEINCLLTFDNAIASFQKIVEEGLPKMALKSFKSLFYQHWSTTSLAYHGNPTNGLQVMGILETRMLDFERLIILGFNEGSLPTTNPIKTLIPLDLRSMLGLPSTRDKQGVFAHHFYRLLHEAKHMTATFTSAADNLGSQEKSRYLLQMELELTSLNKQLNVKHEMYAIPIDEVSKIETGILQKTPFIIDRVHQFFERTISASSISKYISCSLDFYYRYLVEFGEDKSVEEDIETHTFGTFIHNTLDTLYAPYATFNKEGERMHIDSPPITEAIIDKMIADFPEVLKKEFIDYFDGDDSLFQTGKNALSFSVAKEMTLKFLEAEKDFVMNSQEPLTIERLESRFDTSFTIEIENEVKTIKIGGYVDRVDKVGNRYRVIDYKSGKVTKENVTIGRKKGSEKLNFKTTKHALQLAFYALMFEEKYGVLPDEVLIISLIDAKGKYPLCGKENQSINEISEQVKEFVQEIYSDMIDSTIDFTHNKSAFYCQYCK